MAITYNEACIIFRNHVQAFCKMTDDEWELILPYLELKTIRKNGLLAREGKKAFEVGFVLEGMFRHFYTKEGQERTTYFYFENHFISSYISCITGKPSLITIEALSSATYISFPYKAMLELFDKSMAWQKFGRLIAEYLTVGLEERMVSLLLQSPEERYLDLLNSNRKKILERVPQHYIANYLGITPVSMSRIRNRLTKK
jgi:CRP-like cAMP-binding protein